MKDINLLPKDYKRGFSLDIGSVVFIAAFLGSAVLLVAAFILMSLYNLSINVRINGCNKDIKKYDVVERYVSENSSLQSQIDARRKFLDYIHPKVTISDYMGYVTYCAPKDAHIKISSYVDDGSNVTITCGAKNLDELSDFITNLKAIGVFPSIKMQSFTSDANSGMTAVLLCSRTAAAAAAAAGTTAPAANQ